MNPSRLKSRNAATVTNLPRSTRFNVRTCWRIGLALAFGWLCWKQFSMEVVVSTITLPAGHTEASGDHPPQYYSPNNLSMTTESNNDDKEEEEAITNEKSRPMSQRKDSSNKTTTTIDNKDVYANRNKNNTAKLPAVLHFPAYVDGDMDLRQERDGLNSSKGLYLVHDIDASMLYPNISWIGSPRPNKPCNDKWIRQAMEFYHRQSLLLPSRRRRKRQQYQQQQKQNLNIKPDWTIHLCDWYDPPNILLRCVKLEKIVGLDKFRYWKRSVVAGRRWNNETQSMELGHLLTHVSGMPVHFLAYPVRTDIVNTIASYAHNNIMTYNNNNVTNQTMNPRELTNYLVSKDRPGDVAHYWPVIGGKVDRGSRFGSNSELRTKTSETLLDMMLPPYNLRHVFCNQQGAVGNKGRRSVSESYVKSMLQFKIIVVVQRDGWEGHWRLFEAMVSGAMVIHDRMLAVPMELKENVNIVLFDTMDDLKQKVMYYLRHPDERLRIAQKGRQVAMCYHRSWHRMEQIIAGRTITPCYE